MKFTSRIGNLVKGKTKQAAAGMAYMGYQAGSKQLIEKIYKQFYQHCDNVLEDKIEKNDYKYWKNKVRGKFFGKNVNNPSNFVLEMRPWLDGFAKRIRDKTVNDEDKEIIKKYLLPYMKQTEEFSFSEYLKKFKVI